MSILLDVVMFSPASAPFFSGQNREILMQNAYILNKDDIFNFTRVNFFILALNFLEMGFSILK